ncbi:MAG: AAA family ATPase, partial [Bacteroidota bacterium]
MELQYIKKIILEYHDFIQNIELKRRYFPIEVLANYVIIGPRRAGKTYYLYQLIQEFCEGGNSIEDIVFLNFEDERFMEFRHQDFDSILQAYRELFDTKPILFFDEIHIVAGWEKFVRRLADTGYRVYVSGSNAQMLSHDIATTLGGRFMVKEILPLSFGEYLAFQNFTFIKQDLLRDSKVALIKRFYHRFFYSGAFPETLLFAQS